MTEILTSAQMRAVELAAIESGSVTGLALMERAGAAVVEAIFATWPDLAKARALVLCGPGNNGGDGYVIARLLHARGLAAQAVSFGDPARLPPDAAANHARAVAQGLVIPALPERLDHDLIIDALFGTGLTRPLTGFDGLIAKVNAAPARLVSVDVPSGCNADNPPEARDWPTLRSDLVVTFHTEKPVHAALRQRGIKTIVAGIGL